VRLLDARYDNEFVLVLVKACELEKDLEIVLLADEPKERLKVIAGVPGGVTVGVIEAEELKESVADIVFVCVEILVVVLLGVKLADV
jgi:hypothetical protein